MTMKLYEVPKTPNSIKIHAVGYELDIQFQSVPVDLFGGEGRSKTYLEKNPNGKVPVLEIAAGDYLWESNAILGYLVAQRPKSTLMPHDARGQSRVNQWLFWQGAHWAPAFGKIVYERVFKPKYDLGKIDEATIATGFEELKRFATVLDSNLKQNEYVAGDVTIADFSLASQLYWRTEGKIDIAAWPNIERWIKQMEARQSWKFATGNK